MNVENWRRIRRHMVRYGTRIERGYGGVPVARPGAIMGVNMKTAAGVGAVSAGLGYKRDRHGEDVDERPPRKVTRGSSAGSYNDVEESVKNLPQHPQVKMSGKGKRAGTDGDEVGVIPPPRKISKIHPDYFTITLPHVDKFTSINGADVEYNVQRPFLKIRLNSIYDPIKEINSTNPAITDDPIKDSDKQPQGRDIWQSHFKYYRVLEARVKLTFLNSSVNTTTDPFWNSFAIGYELSDENAALCQRREMFLMTKHAKRAILPATVEHFGNTRVPSSEVMAYKYRPESWDFHVEEMGSEERWTPIKQNPAIDHDLNVRFFHMSTAAANVRVGVLVQIEYDVQFREGTDAFIKTYTPGAATYGGADEDALDD